MVLTLNCTHVLIKVCAEFVCVCVRVCVLVCVWTHMHNFKTHTSTHTRTHTRTYVHAHKLGAHLNEHMCTIQSQNQCLSSLENKLDFGDKKLLRRCISIIRSIDRRVIKMISDYQRKNMDFFRFFTFFWVFVYFSVFDMLERNVKRLMNLFFWRKLSEKKSSSFVKYFVMLES